METKSYAMLAILQFSLSQNPRVYAQVYLKWLPAQRCGLISSLCDRWTLEPFKSFPWNEEFSFLRGLEMKSYRLRLSWSVLTCIYSSHQQSETHLSVHRRQDKQKPIFQLSIAPGAFTSLMSMIAWIYLLRDIERTWWIEMDNSDKLLL